jgi:hypothetical protein
MKIAAANTSAGANQSTARCTAFFCPAIHSRQVSADLDFPVIWLVYKTLKPTKLKRA